MKLEKGMFIRTNKGYIGKLKKHYLGSITEPNEYVFENGYGFSEADYEYITKHSNNQIDLIEVGDVLTINQFNNDYEKVEVYETFNIYTNKKELCVLANGKPKRVIEVNIKEILTHEQYEANVYKLGDDGNERKNKTI